jgi:hypothetical protein
MLYIPKRSANKAWTNPITQRMTRRIWQTATAVLSAMIPPPPTYVHLIPSTFNFLKDNLTPAPPPYSAASAAKAIAPWGFLLPHNKADFGLKSIDFDSQSIDSDLESLDCDSQSTAFDSESLDFGSKSMAFNSKSLDFDSKSMTFDLKFIPYIFRNKQAILPCGRFAPCKEKNILRTIHVS